MDLYKSEMMKRTGPGGLKCPCCNNSRCKRGSVKDSKDNSLNKLARSKLKFQLKKETSCLNLEMEI